MQQRLHAIRHRHLFRQLSPLSHGSTPWISVDGHKLLNLSSNNYLGFADHPHLKQAASAAIEQYGCGTGSSRLIAGSTFLHQQLEARLAAFKGHEQALLFTSGYQANVGIIAALAGPRDIILSDELNHASLIDGCRLSGAQSRTYAHCSLIALQQQLEECSTSGQRGLTFVVTDSVFSMDGDLAPLAEIAALCERYQAFLIVDEAHASGCLGPAGRGLVAQLPQSAHENILTISTLSKAFGSIGAFMSGTTLMKDFLINVARPFIFTTSLPPADLAASLAALDLLEEDPDLPGRLQQKAAFFRTSLQQLGFDTLASATHIIPLLIGDAERTMHMAAHLREEGLYAVAIRPPTVPMGASRLRFSLMASHTDEDLFFALDIIKKVGSQMGLV
ncbi:8-amino-7-oxononanoate synthase [Tengunoibacter tsumagoiensis]|uniref:8-amino-7-ketopelargonate synthase n=2 Tax=Tengunoibacter tsumagoiensis TaxID=2014871 RepID=A0A402A7S1_9CHLR|nr:8-amino-7-oxononanoate synthase [Tengunoibacter tsumagoiensis]